MNERRHFSIHTKDRSATRRWGITAKVCSSLRLATCTFAPSMGQALGIDGNLALDTRDLFACVIALVICTVGVFTLCASTIKKPVKAARPCFIRAAPT
jgi:hypothetical protein